MNPSDSSSSLSTWSPAARVLLIGASIVVIVYGMQAASGILNSLLLALFISIGFSPVMHYLIRKGLPVWLSLVGVLSLILVAGLIIVAIVVGSLGGFDQKLPAYEENLSGLTDDISTQLETWGVDVSGIDLAEVLRPERVISLIEAVVGAVVASMSSVILMLLIIAFMLADATSFMDRVSAAFPGDSNFPSAAAEFGQDIRSYLFLKGWLSALATIPITLLYIFLGTDFALLWGLVFFLFSFIPNIGYVLSVIPPALVTLLEFGWERMLVLIVINVIINTLVDNVISPRYMGRGLGLSTLIVFLSLIIWGWVLGPLGALLSVPMTIMVKRLYLERYAETRFLAELIGQEIKTGRPPDDTPPEVATAGA